MNRGKGDQSFSVLSIVNINFVLLVCTFSLLFIFKQFYFKDNHILSVGHHKMLKIISGPLCIRKHQLFREISVVPGEKAFIFIMIDFVVYQIYEKLVVVNWIEAFDRKFIRIGGLLEVEIERLTEAVIDMIDFSGPSIVDVKLLSVRLAYHQRFVTKPEDLSTVLTPDVVVKVQGAQLNRWELPSQGDLQAWDFDLEELSLGEVHEELPALGEVEGLGGVSSDVGAGETLLEERLRKGFKLLLEVICSLSECLVAELQ